ncbi:conjugal transfer protein, partial [Citrobacter freundii]
VFKVNEQIISRFQIKNTPVLISTEKDKFRITQFSEAEIRGVGEKISAEEN